MMSQIFRKDGLIAISFAVAVSAFLVVSAASATTTISTDISTGGALSVGDDITLQSGTTIDNGTDGTVTFNDASTGNTATVISTGDFTAAFDLNAQDDLNVTDDATIGDLASSSRLRIGSDSVSTISGIVFGFCNIADTSVAASSTAYANCTGATGVTSSYKVFVQATSSLPGAIVIHSASSTATSGTIQVRLLNTGLNGAAVTSSGINSINFWAVR